MGESIPVDERGYFARLASRWAAWVGLILVPVSVGLLVWPNLFGSGMPGWIAFPLASLLIFWAQYAEWRLMVRERDQWEAWYRRSFMEDEISHMYGPEAPMRRIDRLRGIQDRWNREAGQVRAGDFSNAAAIPALAREYLRV